MAKPTEPLSADQAAIVKGKVPRNALIAVGAVASVAIGAIGFYYQLQESRKAEQEAHEQKKAKAAEVVDKSNRSDDVDKIIADQQADARRAAAAARAASAPDAPASAPRPTLSADGLVPVAPTEDIKAKSDEDAIYASPVFRPGVKAKEAAPQQGSPNGIVTPQQMLLQQAAAQAAAMNAANSQAALAARAGQAGGPVTTQQRDTDFMKSVGAQSESGRDFARAGFVGQSHGCTLSPPAHIPVLSVEGFNSDRPGTASLVVEKDVYDSLTGTCLMIPWGTTITAPYSADVQPGQESILVAATEMRLPNGKHVPLYGAQGADADGTAGFSGHVNTHFWKIYGTSFLTAILLNHFEGGNSSTTTGPLGVTQVSSTAGQVAATTAQSVLGRYQNIPPTITGKPGERHFMIKVNRDITLEPYRND
ncbi:TPA: TrbI/VirB10 family protein [Burkholderia vietnamiensis]|uniref:TrbI/VirB10 family protein n=1 Tax=Burkholderia vietnamiensis TaxID=60552 RepID=UPI00075A1FE4|nr:TrbI/VirB10 family protein [Burkholderia vietnamiensis]KVS21253.1 conjugal transfer protein TraI [Burkholderia vietnamiensis]MBR7912067.1 TrbI/VirB10 family protein [Burkholderia vietnamiensis]MBR8001723.1 TrbI/VirB10 family protein [Burkholderia vietnamiensis]MBR8014863.1 TrbI/VirB10 family protein [Burkholderia vietnamiensis]MCA7947245.1 TrbI/VirB10 family protein [Burkholderia vietnamiensis]